MLKIGLDARIIDAKYKTGMGVYASNLIDSLHRYNSQNEYFLIFSSLKRTVKKVAGLSDDGFPKVRIPFPQVQNKFLRLLWPKILSYYLKRLEIDIYHSLYHYDLPKDKKFKTVITIHDLHRLRLKGDFLPKQGLKTYFETINRAIQTADAIVTDSHATKQDILDFFNIRSEKINVIHLAADEIYKPIKNYDQLSRIREKYKLPARIILTVGAGPRKNPFRIIEAFGLLKTRFSIPHKLVFTGSPGGWTEKHNLYKKKLKIENVVMWLGYVSKDDMLYLYNCAEVLVFPSLYEGFGLPVLEAMSCRTPVLTSNCSSLSEISEDAALLVNPYEIEEIANGIYRVISDDNLRENLKIKGLEQSAKFSWEKHVKEMELLYQSLINA